MVIALSGATDANGDPLTYAITKVTQDEKVAKAISKTDKGPDAQRVAGKPNQIKLRAERDRLTETGASTASTTPSLTVGAEPAPASRRWASRARRTEMRSTT